MFSRPFEKKLQQKSHKKLKSSAGSTIEDSKTILKWRITTNNYILPQGQTGSPDLLSDFLNSKTRRCLAKYPSVLMKSKRKYFGMTAILRSAERRFFVSKISSMLTLTFYLSKTLKILSTFVVPFWLRWSSCSDS